ncbi:hypothetical protein RJ639_004682 [Escallonia herrerae]|uniref:Uncharacterized protein n=1 Tax=Escallonia herrerae TaxID=1293975 RepID=A0AA88W4H8_9ASTE|nr:hypothetical protein RJ639_004682 [Escallonia herrerae]
MNWYQDLQTYQFLMGLDDKYATLRTQIINMDPFPNIDRVYAMVMQEESHRGITGSRDTTPTVGFHTQNGLPTARSSGLVSATVGDPDRTPTGRPWCTFCHRVGHTQEKCYRCLGIAPPGKGRGRGRGSPAMSQNAVGSSFGPLQASAAATQNNGPSLSQAQAAATSALSGLTPEQMQCLITFLESSPSGTDSLVVAAISESESYELWHWRMGHPSSQPLIHLPTVPVVSPSFKTICDVCCRAKHTWTVFPDSTSRAMGIFGLIHCDIWGPYRSDNGHEFDSQPMTQFYDDQGKFAPRSRRCVFLGYPPGKKGWRVYDLETNQVFFSRDGKFEDTVFPFTTPLGPSLTPATTTFCPAWDCIKHPMASPPVIGGDTTSDRGRSATLTATPSLGLSGITMGPDPEISSPVLHRALLLLRLPLLVVKSDKRKLLLFSRTMYVTLLKFFPPASSTPTNGSSVPSTMAALRNWRFFSADTNKVDEPFKAEEAETVDVPPSTTVKLLVLGGNGFVGSHVCKEALNHGLSVASLSSALLYQLVKYSPFPRTREREHDGEVSCIGGFGSNSYMYKINGTANINAIRAAAEQG